MFDLHPCPVASYGFPALRGPPVLFASVATCMIVMSCPRSSGSDHARDRLVRLLLPPQGQFFNLLEGIADQIEAAAGVFAELETADGHAQMEAIAVRLKPIEKAADELERRLHEELDRTFVTPIDREDLAALSKALDDVVDGMEHAATFAALYQFDRLTDPMRAPGAAHWSRRPKQLAAAGRHLRRFADPEAGHGGRGRPSTSWRTRPTGCTARPSPPCSPTT